MYSASCVESSQISNRILHPETYILHIRHGQNIVFRISGPMVTTVVVRLERQCNDSASYLHLREFSRKNFYYFLMRQLPVGFPIGVGGAVTTRTIGVSITRVVVVSTIMRNFGSFECPTCSTTMCTVPQFRVRWCQRWKDTPNVENPRQGQRVDSCCTKLVKIRRRS